jgi:hypothetical protein
MTHSRTRLAMSCTLAEDPVPFLARLRSLPMFTQGGQELDASACGCRASSLAGARFRPLPAPPRTLVCDPCSCSSRISALPSSIYVQIQKIFCTILLHMNRSEIIPPSKNLLRGADFSTCTRYYFDRKHKLVA